MALKLGSVEEIQGGGTRENWGTESGKEEGDPCWKRDPTEGEKGFEKAAGRENGGDAGMREASQQVGNGVRRGGRHNLSGE